MKTIIAALGLLLCGELIQAAAHPLNAAARTTVRGMTHSQKSSKYLILKASELKTPKTAEIKDLYRQTASALHIEKAVNPYFGRNDVCSLWKSYLTEKNRPLTDSKLESLLQNQDEDEEQADSLSTMCNALSRLYQININRPISDDDSATLTIEIPNFYKSSCPRILAQALAERIQYYFPGSQVDTEIIDDKSFDFGE